MKKIFALLCACLLIFSLAACNDNPSPSPSGQTPSNDASDDNNKDDKDKNDNDSDGNDPEKNNPNKNDSDENDPDKDNEEDKNLAGKALAIVQTFFLNRLDVWHFLPEALSAEKMAVTSPAVDFNTSFVSASAIENKAIGKQMNVVYDVLQRTESIASVVDTVVDSENTIVDLYQTFINDHPDNYASYTKETDHFDFRIEVTNDTNVLLVRLTTAAIEINYNIAAKETTVRVQLTDGNVLKYEKDETHFKAALSILNVAKWQVEFTENEDGSADGTIYEFYGTAAHNIKTVACIHTDETMTYVIADKRETDDLKIEGYLEAYSSVTGEFLGAEVKENAKLFDYDTLWLPLSDVQGINSVKKLDETNKLNADTVFINGKSGPIETKIVGLTNPSRRYDIEFKEVWYFMRNEEGKYVKEKYEIPMLFVQTENYDTLEDDFKEKNNVTIAVRNGEIHAAIEEAYLQEASGYATLKEKVEVSELDTYIGSKNSFFN